MGLPNSDYEMQGAGWVYRFQDYYILPSLSYDRQDLRYERVSCRLCVTV